VVVRGRRTEAQTFGGTSDWEVIDDQTGISAVATHDIFWADGVYDEIEISAWGVVIGTDIQHLEGLLSTDGSTFLNGVADYEWSSHQSHQGASENILGSDSSGDTTVRLVDDMGTATDEHVDLTIHIKNVSNVTRKKTFSWEYTGIIDDGFFTRLNGGAILRDNNNSLRGFRFDGEGATTFSADRIRVRGRRVLSTTVQTISGDFVHMGTFTVASGGDTFIDIDFRSSVNPQFADFQDTDYMVSISGLIGPGNNQLEGRQLRLGVAQSGSADYKDDSIVGFGKR